MIWLISEYTGFLLCVIMAGVIAALLIFAYIVELVQKSKVPKSYFRWMLVCCLAPALVCLAFSLIYQGNFDWLEG